jgi:predicted permease
VPASTAFNFVNFVTALPQRDNLNVSGALTLSLATWIHRLTVNIVEIILMCMLIVLGLSMATYSNYLEIKNEDATRELLNNLRRLKRYVHKLNK